MIHINLHKTLLGQSGTFNLEVDLEITPGEFICVYGPSGAGKSSLLRMISGLMAPDLGQITLGDKTWYNSKQAVNLKPQQRNLSFVFQQAALFPNMNVKQNLEFALQDKSKSTFLNKLVKYAELEPLLNRKPESLSGGQKQRVALVRALAQQAQLTLLDEPLAALDQEARLALQDLLYTLHKETNQTIIMVSHDLPEVIKLANRVYCLDQGKIIKTGTPESVFLTKIKANQMALTGVVLNLERNNGQGVITVLLASGKISLEVRESELEGLAAGSKIQLTITDFKPEITKIIV